MHLHFSRPNDIAPCYRELVAALRERGFDPYMNDRVTLMVARRRPAMPNDGNCFFVLFMVEWFLKPMCGWTYQITGTVPPIDLCLELLNFDKTLGDVPEDIRTRHGLRPLDQPQGEALEARIYRAESLLPPTVDLETFVSTMRDRDFKVERSATAPACAVTGKVAGSGLWFALHDNHWHVKTAAGILYSCWDDEVIGLCIYALKNEEPVLERFSDRFIRGYHMRELPEPEKQAVLRGSGLDLM